MLLKLAGWEGGQQGRKADFPFVIWVVGQFEIQPRINGLSEAPASEPGAVATGSSPPHSTHMAAQASSC